MRTAAERMTHRHNPFHVGILEARLAVRTVTPDQH
jgi:hypothetical protein